jgi:polyhydroxyalkanoate synthase
MQGDKTPCAVPQHDDKRFSKPAWAAQPFNAMAQAFLLQEQWWDEATRGVRGVSAHHEDVTHFTARQWLDTMSPSNFVATNPEVLRHTMAEGGLNLVNGHANWMRDAIAVLAHGKPRGVEAFRPGEGVALTPGQVVMRNRLVELIQYEPATPRVRRNPVLIVPSWIMKYYILDLTPDDSLVRWLVSRGHTVFTISWRNPGAEDAGLGMDDYLQLGFLESLEAVKRICPRTRVNAMGYCLGGTLLTIGAALLALRKDASLRTISLLAAETDFEEPGELGLFIDESQIAFLEDLMAQQGYLDGRQMAGAFQLINSKDLVWSKLVHEYLMGAQTPVTALRAWNADATRMPARMHSEYLRSLYLRNELAEGDYRALGETVDLGRIDTPMFVVATEHDHVSPWRSVYKLLRMVSAPAEFLLSSGGHNVGIVNPPSGPLAYPQASYRSASHRANSAPPDAEAWLAQATQHEGSWWPRWDAWLRRHNGGEMAARHPQGGIAPAPGTYVMQE